MTRGHANSTKRRHPAYLFGSFWVKMEQNHIRAFVSEFLEEDMLLLRGEECHQERGDEADAHFHIVGLGHTRGITATIRQDPEKRRREIAAIAAELRENYERLRIEGTAPLMSVELICGWVGAVTPFPAVLRERPKLRSVEMEVKVSLPSRPCFLYPRVLQADRHFGWASPVWIE